MELEDGERDAEEEDGAVDEEEVPDSSANAWRGACEQGQQARMDGTSRKRTRASAGAPEAVSVAAL